jgi:hypothetical protein
MISQQWRERLSYAAMSAFLAWHTVAIVLAPAPAASGAAQALRAVFQPYLSLLRLDNQWDFFAPRVDRAFQFRYIIEDRDGNHHPFTPDRDLNRSHPSFFWLRRWYIAIMDKPAVYADVAAAYFCRKHAALHPVSIILLDAEQTEDFTPEDQLNGKHPLDPEFVTVTTVKRVACTGS